MRFLEMFPASEDHAQIVDDLSFTVGESDGVVDLRDWLLEHWIIDADDSVLALLGINRDDPKLLAEAAGYGVTISSESKCTFTDVYRESPDEYSTHYWITVCSPDGDLAVDEGTDDEGYEAIQGCIEILINDLVRRCCEHA